MSSSSDARQPAAGPPWHRSVRFALAAVLLVAAAWSLLAVRIAGPGLEVGVKDQRHYLASARELTTKGRLAMPEYAPHEDRVNLVPLTSFPPLYPLFLAALLVLGVPITAAPTMLALLAWPLLLVGIGALTQRLTGDRRLALFAVAIAAVTWPYLNVYTKVQSESLYLPFTVLAVLAYDGLLDRRTLGSRFAVALGLTTLLLLTRYTGIFFYVAVGGWWLVGRLVQRQPRRLLRELPWLALPGVVFALWLVHNVDTSGHLFGPILMSSTMPEVGAGDVALSFLRQGVWLVLPAVRPGAVWRATGLWGAAAALPVVSLAAALLVAILRRRAAHHNAEGRRLLRSPLLPFLFFYVGFLAVAPSFMRMQGMIERYMAVVLCLAQPWGIACLRDAPKRWAYGFLALFLALNVGLAVAFTSSQAGLGRWFEAGAWHAADLGGNPPEQMDQLLAGTPAWWVHRPPRARDVDNHLPTVARWLADAAPGTVVVSNAPELFAWRPMIVAPRPVAAWLDDGTCTPSVPLVVVVVDWDRWSHERNADPRLVDPRALRRRIESRCPNLVGVETPHATIYASGGAG